MSRSSKETEEQSGTSEQLQAMQALVDERTRALFQAEKLASIGLLAAGVAHEIKNPVGFISANLEILDEYIHSYQSVLVQILTLIASLKTASKTEISQQVEALKSLWAAENIDQINGDINQLLTDSMVGTQRINDIVNNMNQFVSIDDDVPVLCDLNEELDTTLKLIRHELKNAIKVHLTNGELPRIYALPADIHHAFLNLLMNAIHSIRGPGDIWLATVFDEDCISISIRDSGYGIHAADIDKIFEPFFSTKNSDEGTGLGLSICMSIIKNHGGNLTVNSTPAQGSEFIITLPTGNQPQDVVSTASSISSRSL